MDEYIVVEIGCLLQREVYHQSHRLIHCDRQFTTDL
jgi:hypothetical protein